MKASQWDEKLFAAHRNYIEVEDVRRAFDLLTAAAFRSDLYSVQNSGLTDQKKSFHYNEPISAQRPFAFIVNQSHLLFYIRLAGQKRFPDGISHFKKLFATVNENHNGEWTIRVETLKDAARIQQIVLSAVRSGDFDDSSSAPSPEDLENIAEREIEHVTPTKIPAFTRISDDALTGESTATLDHDRRDIVSMTTLHLSAVRVRQGDLTLYTTSIPVKDLIVPGFYSVETLDPENANDHGYQRLLNTARAKKLADYIVNGQDSRDAFLPTSVFLATDRSLPFDETTHMLEIKTHEVGAFSVVDGQHRLEGLRMAAEKDSRVLTFDVAVNIAVNLSRIAQMCHFLIVNTTQKSVDKSVEQRIIKRLTDAIDVEDIPSLPKWILRTVERGEVDKAIRYVDYLNEVHDSPWRGKIKMANTEIATATVNQKTFVKAIVKYVLTPNNPLTAYRDFEKEKKIFLNYWKAIAELLDDGNAAVLFKYNGVELFCKFSIPFFTRLQDKGDFTVKNMKELLAGCFNNVEGEYAGVAHPEWWASGSSASFLNAGAINLVSHELTRALQKSGVGDSDIKL